MKTTKKISGIKVIANVKAGAINPNHNRVGLAVKAGIKAGNLIFSANHSARLRALSA